MNRDRAFTALSCCLKGQIPARLDWMAILELANQTLMTPTLSCTPAFLQAPPEVRDFLDEVRRRNLARNQSLFATLAEATRALNAVNIRPVLLKGCAMWAVGDEIVAQADRITSDIDLMVPPSQADAAVRALCAIDFKVLEDHAASDDPVIAILGRDRDAGEIDLHYRPPCPIGVAELDNLSEFARPVRIGDAEALVPRPELQVLIEALHDLVHDGFYWIGDFNLRHLLDTKALLEDDQTFNWDYLDRVCANRFVRKMTALHLRCAYQIAGANVPKHWLSSLVSQFHYRRMRMQYAAAWTRPTLAWFGRLIRWRRAHVRSCVAAPLLR